MKKKWNLLFLFAFIVSMITLAGCGKTAGEASPYEGKWIAVSAQMIGMSVSVDETFGGAFEFEVKNGGKVSFSVGEVTGNGKWSAKDDKFSLTIEGEENISDALRLNFKDDRNVAVVYKGEEIGTFPWSVAMGYCMIESENPSLSVTINDDDTLKVDYSDDEDYYTFHCVKSDSK